MSIIDQIEQELIDTEKDRYGDRIRYLENLYHDNSQITNGVNAVLKNLNKGERSFVIYGEPQSGKTELMLALTCKFLDEGFETVFIVMNDNRSLENQNFYRFADCPQLDPQPMLASEVIADPTSIVPGEKHVIFVRKNGSILERINEITRHLKKRVILDDESDFASPDNKINTPGDAGLQKFHHQTVPGWIDRKQG